MVEAVVRVGAGAVVEAVAKVEVDDKVLLEVVQLGDVEEVELHVEQQLLLGEASDEIEIVLVEQLGSAVLVKVFFFLHQPLLLESLHKHKHLLSDRNGQSRICCLSKSACMTCLSPNQRYSVRTVVYQQKTYVVLRKLEVG